MLRDTRELVSDLGYRNFVIQITITQQTDCVVVRIFDDSAAGNTSEQAAGMYGQSCRLKPGKETKKSRPGGREHDHGTNAGGG
jgi:hypothetical protein